MSGIVDVDDICYGDPPFQIALTRMALINQKSNTRYIDFLLDEFGDYSRELLNLYTGIFCIDFLSELGQDFNGNKIARSELKKNHLESILDSLLNEN